MKILSPHCWNLTPAQARALQQELSRQVQMCPLPHPPRLAAGVDCALSPDQREIIAAIIVLERIETSAKICFQPVEQVWSRQPLTFPYIPGLLSFREAPVCLEAAGKLKNRPDVFFFNGQGLAHPRRLGLACHAGLFLNRPAIGCAKNLLIGRYEEPGVHKGSHSELTDHGEIIGQVVRTRAGVKPVFVSAGHLCTLDDAVRTVLAWTSRYRLPEPARLAHQTVTRLRQNLP